MEFKNGDSCVYTSKLPSIFWRVLPSSVGEGAENKSMDLIECRDPSLFESWLLQKSLGFYKKPT